MSFFAADSLGIDIPGKLPDARIDLVKKPGLFHFIPEFGAKDLGKCSDRQEKSIREECQKPLSRCLTTLAWHPLNQEQRHDLLEILEDRNSIKSTIVTSQLP